MGDEPFLTRWTFQVANSISLCLVTEKKMYGQAIGSLNCYSFFFLFNHYEASLDCGWSIYSFVCLSRFSSAGMMIFIAFSLLFRFNLSRLDEMPISLSVNR